MKLSLLTGRAHPALAAAVADRLGLSLAEGRIETFPDGELHVTLAAGLPDHDVYLLQPTGPPAERHLLELLLLADACRRAGAGRITAVIPYFGYARQERRTAAGEAVGARVLADAIGTRVDRIVTIHLHNPAVEGFFSVPVDHLLPVDRLADRLDAAATADSVLVAPDLGAVKLAQHYADGLDLPVAYVHKVRLSGERVEVRRVVGAVDGRRPIVVDDMISTGGTLVSAIEALSERGCRTPVTVAATHAVLSGDALDRLAAQPVDRIIVTNSLPTPEKRSALEVVDIAPPLAEAVQRLHEGRP
jgi:ribose-phosphate pyrophosphokinase